MYTAVTWVTRSAQVEEPVQHPHPEGQPVHRHPLVHAVEHAREVQLRGEPQRGEPEAADAEVVEGLGVGATGQHVRHGARDGVLGAQRGLHGVHEPAVEVGLQRLVGVHVLPLDARAEQPVEAYLDDSRPADDTPSAEAEDVTAEAPSEPKAKPAKKRGRASVPSWDEIMFGGPSDQ